MEHKPGLDGQLAELTRTLQEWFSPEIPGSVVATVVEEELCHVEQGGQAPGVPSRTRL